MFSAKRSQVDDFLLEGRPTKRQVPPTYYEDDGTTLEGWATNSADTFALRPFDQTALFSPSDFNTEESYTPLPLTPGPSDEVCYGMVTAATHMGLLGNLLRVISSVASRHNS